MAKQYKLNTGEEITVIEELQDWDDKEIFYKVKRKNGDVRVIRQLDFFALTKQAKNHLSTLQKIELFYQYFRGREDVYATKWISKNGRTGYSPHGDGEWIMGENGKLKKEIHTYYPYTLKTIEQHIRGEHPDFKHGAGIYPLLPDDTTYLIVMDFDTQKATEEVQAIIQTCHQFNIDYLLERSQSGAGIHVWCFFENAIPASIARKFANNIIQHAMQLNSAINFDSFDRIIPMQDTLPKNGFGNLIALPLRQEKALEGKTVFLNDDLGQVENMWESLAKVKRYSEEEIQDFIKNISAETPISLYHSSNSREKIDLPNSVKIIHGGELKVNKNSLSRKQQVALAQQVTFHNPKFYLLQNMRSPTWDTPQFITAAQEDSDYLYLPRGILGKVLHNHPEIILQENISDGYKINVSFKGKLKPNQQRALQQVLNHEMGVISAPTGFGKTVLAAKLIAERQVSTLIIVHSKVLAQQWKERLDQFLVIKDEPYKEYTPTGRVRKKDTIGEIYGSKNKQSRLVDIVLFQTLSYRDDLDDFFTHYGQVIVDEAHHLAASSYEEVIKKANSRYLHGLTATPERKDGLHPLMFMRLGEIIYNDQAKIDDSVLIPRYFYPRFTSYSDYNPELTHIEHLEKMQLDENRNAQIVQDVIENIKLSQTCLVLTNRIEHIELLAELLKDASSNTPIFTLHSQQKKQVNDQNLENMKRIKDASVIIATGQYVGEGFDLASLDSLFIAMPFSSKTLTQQYLGRLNRNLENKDELRVYDYIDFAVDIYRKMYQKRMKEYLKLGYVLAEDEKTRSNQIQLYDNTNYYEPLKADLSQAREAIIGIPYLNKSILSELKQIKQSKIDLMVVISERDAQNSKLVERLTNLNIQINLSNSKPQNFVVCDNKTVWYGSLEYFNTINTDNTAIRLINREIASQLNH